MEGDIEKLAELGESSLGLRCSDLLRDLNKLLFNYKLIRISKKLKQRDPFPIDLDAISKILPENVREKILDNFKDHGGLQRELGDYRLQEMAKELGLNYEKVWGKGLEDPLAYLGLPCLNVKPRGA